MANEYFFRFVIATAIIMVNKNKYYLIYFVYNRMQIKLNA